MNNSKPDALSRTWKTHNSDKMDGAVIRAHSHTVTLSRAAIGAPLTAEVDGEAADLKEAVLLLEDAHTVEVLAEVLAPLPAPTIGKARAHKLHKILGRYGLPHAYHYQGASEALGRKVASLASLTEGEARRVWRYLCGLFPTLPQVAA